MNFHVVSLFPESLGSYVNESIIGRAQKDGVVNISYYNPRDFVKLSKAKIAAKTMALQSGKLAAKNTKVGANFIPYKRVDDKPYGGGPGMVMQAEPLIKAIEKALAVAKKAKGGKGAGTGVGGGSRTKKSSQKGAQKAPRIKIIFLTPSGKQFTNAYAKQAAQKFDHVILICGRYEGMDARVKKIFKAEEISVGPFVLTGGELGAMIIIDTMSRQIEGVLGNFNSVEESRVASSEVYTRPEVLIHAGKKYRVPKVLLSGDHAKIEAWRNRSVGHGEAHGVDNDATRDANAAKKRISQ